MMIAPYYAGAAVPLGSLACVLYATPRTGKGVRHRKAFVLAVLSCVVYVAPAPLCGYASLGA